MIEQSVRNYLNEHLGAPAYMERPKGVEVPETYVMIERVGGSRANQIASASIAVQSYAGSMYDAAALNEEVKAVMDTMAELPEIGRVKLSSDYNFTDTTKKQYRYQAVFEIVYYG